jgi:TRAP-type C4-dicarboxylate transport system permease small subunit
MTSIMLYQVVLRYCFNAANIWAEELAKFMFVWVTLLGASMAIRRNVHLRVDLFVGLLPPKPRFTVQIVTYTLILGFLIYLCFLAVELISNTTVNRSAGLRVPMAIPYSAILVGGVLMVLACIEFIGKKVEEYRQILRESSADGGKA